MRKVKIEKVKIQRREVFVCKTEKSCLLAWDGNEVGQGELYAVFYEQFNAESFAEAHGWEVDYSQVIKPDGWVPPDVDSIREAQQ